MNKLILSTAIFSFLGLSACSKQDEVSNDVKVENTQSSNNSSESFSEKDPSLDRSEGLSEIVALEQQTVELIDKTQKCLSKDELNSSLDPAVLASSSYTCVMNGDYENALYSYTLSLFYAQYDVNRLVDKTKYTPVFSNYLAELEKTDKSKSQPFVDYFNSKRMEPNFDKNVCSFYREIGTPTYELDYLNLKVENKKFTDDDFIVYDPTMLMDELLKSCS